MHRDPSFNQVMFDSVRQIVDHSFVIATSCCPNYAMSCCPKCIGGVGYRCMVMDYYGERPRRGRNGRLLLRIHMAADDMQRRAENIFTALRFAGSWLVIWTDMGQGAL